MKTLRLLAASLLTLMILVAWKPSILAGVPTMISYQGRLSQGGTNVYDGSGHFKFALVDGGTNLHRQATAVATVIGGFIPEIVVTDGGIGYDEAPVVAIIDPTGSNAVAVASISNSVVTEITMAHPGVSYSPSPTVIISPPPPDFRYVTYWSNDGTSNKGGEPAEAVPLQVSQGVFAVNLGDSSLSNMLAEIPPAIFTNSDVRLRIWFSDGIAPFQQFYPDQRLTSAGYAMIAENVVDGAITSTKIATGAVVADSVSANSVTTGSIADGAVTATKLASGAVTESAVGVNAISSAKILDEAITAEKLADGAVTRAKLASGAVSGIYHSMAVFTTNGVWVKPPDVERVQVKLWGGGGGGDTNADGGGGGGGGYCEGVVTVTNNVTVSVGLGGTPGNGGGSSSFLSLIAGGGSSGSWNAGGTGGTASGGTVIVTGQRGAIRYGGNAAMGGGQGGGRETVFNGEHDEGGFPGGGGGPFYSGKSNGLGASGLVVIYY